MAEKTNVYSYCVTHEPDVEEGISYLRDDLDFNEARIFFDQARQKGFAEFEDDEDRQYTLLYKDGNYTLVRR